MSVLEVKSDISQKQLRKNIFSMLWPATMESVLQMMVGIVATAMVGRLGAVAIGSVGLGNRISHLVWAIFRAVGVGATVLVARAIGKQDYSLGRRVALQSMIVGVFLVSIITILIFGFARPILYWFGAEGELFEVSIQYLRIVVFGMPFMAVMQIVGAIMRGAGNTKTPMIIALIMNVINVIVSYTLIFGNFGFPRLGVKGAAYGAIIAQSISAGIAIWIIYRPKLVISFSLIEQFKVEMYEIKRLLKIGSPVAGESLFWQFATIILTKWIVGFGAVSLAAHQLGLQAESLSYMPAAGFAIAATAFVGQSLGKQDPELATRYTNEIFKWCIIFTSITAGLLLFFPKQILAIFTTEVEVIELAKYYLMLMALIQVPQQITSSMIGALRGAGMTKPPMINTGIGIWLIRLPLSFILGVVMGYGVIGVWIAITIDIVVRFFLNLRLYRKGDWKHAEIL
ncbi:MAG: MATE family efflux transporter [Clostridia bacterium]